MNKDKKVDWEIQFDEWWDKRFAGYENSYPKGDFYDLIKDLLASQREGIVVDIRERLNNLVEIEPVITLEKQKVLSLSWNKYLDLRNYVLTLLHSKDTQESEVPE